MKVTLLAPLSKVNNNVELWRQSRADDRVRRWRRWADARPGASRRRVRLTAAWDGSDASLVFLADSLSSDSAGQTLAIGGRRERVHPGPEPSNIISTRVLKTLS